MEQTRLFRLAVEAGYVTFWHQAGRGWHLQLGCRRGDESWADAEAEVYDALTTVELLDVITAHLDSAL